MKSAWGKEVKLKYTKKQEAPIKEIVMTKEEFDKYIKQLEMKKYKPKQL